MVAQSHENYEKKQQKMLLIDPDSSEGIAEINKKTIA